jgi:hypothetical protein
VIFFEITGFLKDGFFADYLQSQVSVKNEVNINITTVHFKHGLMITILLSLGSIKIIGKILSDIKFFYPLKYKYNLVICTFTILCIYNSAENSFNIYKINIYKFHFNIINIDPRVPFNCRKLPVGVYHV